MEKTREQLKRELKELYNLLKEARIECNNAKGIFNQDTCGICASCILLKKINNRR